MLSRHALFLRRGRGRNLWRERGVARQESIASGEEQRSFPATYRDVLLLCHDEGPGASRVPELPDPGNGSSLGS